MDLIASIIEADWLAAGNVGSQCSKGGIGTPVQMLAYDLCMGICSMRDWCERN